MLSTMKIKPAKRDRVRFNILVVGETGQGKTTFLHALLRKYAADVSIGSPEVPLGEKTIKIARVGTFLLSTDAGDEVDVNCYDSPGYGDFVDNTSSIENIKKYVMQCHKSWKSLDAQSMTESDFLLADERIHCMFYFMGAHRMKAIDREFIAALAPLVPIVPIIGKADAMTLPERATYLDTVQRHLSKIAEKINGNCVYDFDGDDLLFDTEAPIMTSVTPIVSSPRASSPVQRNASPSGNRVRPFAPAVSRLPIPIEKSRYSDLHEHLTGRTSTLSVDDSVYDHSLETTTKQAPLEVNLFLRQPNIFAVICDATAQRTYPWGAVPIENTQYSDFRRLQAMIFETDRHLKGLMDECRRKTIVLFRPPPPVPSPVLSLTVQQPEFNEPNPEDLPYCPKTIEISPGHPSRSNSPSRIGAPSPATSDRSMNLGNVVKQIKEGRPSLFGQLKNKLR